MSSTERRRHDRALDLAATRVDFDLAPIELRELEEHLANLPVVRPIDDCTRRSMRGLSARRPGPAVSARRHRGHAAIQGQDVRTQPRLLSLVVAAALLLVVALGIAAIGGFLLRAKPPLVVVPPPSAPAIAVTDPSASPSPRSSSGPDLPESLILYSVGEDATATIHAIGADGGQDRVLATGSDPSWSPDGHSIAYDCRSADAVAGGEPGDICVMDADGADQRVAVAGAHAARWSPDGLRIMFSRSMIDGGDTWVAGVDGSGARLIGAGTGAWSPDGTQILLLGASGAVPDATIVRSDGSGARTIGDCGDAAWSPDGSELACTGEVDGEGFLHVVSPSDRSIHILYEDAFRMSHPTWVSPDLIAFVRGPLGSSDSTDDRLYLLDFGLNSNFQIETRLLLDRPVTGAIVVSPEGSWVAATVSSGETNDIYAVSVAGEQLRVTTAGVTSAPVWQPRDPALPPPSPSPSPSPLPRFAALGGALLVTERAGWVTTGQGLYRTDDMGRTWATVDAPAPHRPDLMVAPDADTIYLILPGPPPTIASSHDGGATWTTASVVEPETSLPMDLTFRTPDHGFASFLLGDETAVHVYETTDGGTTWTGPVVSPMPDVGYSKPHGGPTQGLLWLSNGKADDVPFDNRLLLSLDGGATWVERRFPIGPAAPKDELKWPIAMWADGSGPIVLAMSLGDGGQIYVSDDDGRSWRFVRSWPSFISGTVTVDYHVAFLSESEWVLVAKDGSVVWSTSDGGVEWREVAGPTRVLIDDVSVSSADHIWAVHHCDRPAGSTVGPDPYCEMPGIRTVLLATRDGGRTWTSIGD